VTGKYDLLFAQADGKAIYRVANGIKRLKMNGTADNSFGTFGIAAGGYANFTADSLDRIIAWKLIDGGRTMCIARFTPDGKIDSTFGDGDGLVDVNLPVVGVRNLMITPTDDMVATSLDRGDAGTKWFATRLKGGTFADTTGRKLVISGSAGADTIALSSDGTRIKASLNGKVKFFSKSAITSIDVNAFGGDDKITIGAGLPMVNANGGDGNDTFYAANNHHDALNGGPGTDRAKGDTSHSVADSVLSIESFLH
jgi:hypothetical protein